MPIVSAIVGAIGAVASAIGGAISWLAGGTALAKIAMAGLSMAAQYALGKFLGSKAKAPPAQASKLDTQYGEKLAREIVQGTVGTAGHRVYRNAYSGGNRIVQDVYVLSHWNIAGVSRVRYKGAWKTIGGAVDAERGQRIQGIDAEIWIKLYTGRMDQAADAGLVARSNPPGRWTAQHRGVGVAYAVVTSVLHRETLPQPWEAFFEVVGVTYDWRKDDTAGGEGAHRYGDPTTWEATTNPVLMAYCATRGFWRGDEKIAGKGRQPSALPLSYWTVAANICDETIAGKRRYQAAALLSSGEGSTHDSNLRPLLEACAASWLEMVGQEYPIVGANQTPATTFTDDDIIVDEAFRFAAKRTRSELVNTVAGTYVDPASFYQAMPLATRVDEVALAADGERLAVPLSFSAVTEPACVDRLADIALRASRYQASAELCLRPKFMALRPGQWVTWQSARRGWTKQFQVLSKRLGAFGPKGTRNVYLALQEVGAGIFDPTAYVTVPPDGILQGAPDFQSQLQNFVVVGVTVKDVATGNQYPALRASWSAPTDPTVIGIDIRYRPKTQPAAELPHPTLPDDVTVTTIANGVVSSTVFEISYRLVTSPYRQVPWTAWVEVLTPATPHSDVTIPDHVIEEIEDYTDAATDWIGPHYRALVDEARRLTARILDQDTRNYDDKKKLLVQIQSTSDMLTASYRSEIDVATGPTSALSRRVEALEITMPGKADVSVVNALAAEVSDHDDTLVVYGQAITDIQIALPGKASTDSVLLLANRVTATEGDISALSSALLGVEASVGKIAAGGRLLMEAAANPVDGWAQIGLRTSANNGASFEEAAILLQSRTSGSPRSRAVLKSAQTVIMDASNNILALFDATGIYFSTSRVNIPELMASSAFINNLRISNSLQLDPGVVVTGSISPGAIFNTSSNYISRTGSDWLPGSPGSPADTWINWLSININSPALLPLMVYCGYNVYGTSLDASSGMPGLYIEVRLLLNGVVLPGLYNWNSVTGYSQSVTLANSYMAMPSVSQVSNTITVQGRVRANSPAWNSASLAKGTISLVAQCGRV